MPTWIFKAIQYAIEDIFDISGIPKLQKSSSKELQYTYSTRDEGFFPTDQIYSERKVGSVLDLFLKFAETSLFSGLDDDLLLQPSWSPLPRLLLRGASAKKAKAWGLAVGNYFEAKAESEKPP